MSQLYEDIRNAQGSEPQRATPSSVAKIEAETKQLRQQLEELTTRIDELDRRTRGSKKIGAKQPKRGIKPEGERKILPNGEL